VNVYDNGSLHIEDHEIGIALAGLNGTGDVFIGSKTLSVDHGTFSGVIHNEGEMGPAIPPSLVKTGTGTLTLSGANQYNRGTRVQGGTLVVANNAALVGGDVHVLGGRVQILTGITVSNSIILDGGQLFREIGQGGSFASALPATTSPAGLEQTTA